MIFVALLITLVYTILIVFFIVGCNRLKSLSENNVAPINSFTIVIPFRNEEEVLSNLADSLKKLDYPIANFEILFINDASHDGSVAVIENCFLNSKIDTKILDNELKKQFTKEGCHPNSSSTC